MDDVLIVGAGLFGSTVAHTLANKGFKIRIIEQRDHVGGNIYTEKITDVQIHKYGAHIFHTDQKEIWNFVQKFAEFNRFTNSPLANYYGELYNLPFNMNTFHQLWGVNKPNEAAEIIKNQKDILNGKSPDNLEEQAISLVGTDIYERLIKEYTEKQWGRSCRELPSFIIRRLPVRFSYDNNYFNHAYQGIPIGGYTQIIEKMLDHENISVELGIDFMRNKEELENQAKQIVYTGMIDQYFNFCFGNLEYRSLHFEHEILPIENYQGNAVINYTDKVTPFTRIIEHKHFEFGTQPNTVITREYPKEWTPGDEPYYPVNDRKNMDLLEKYQELAKNQGSVHFGGRLGMYRYYDMDKTIESAWDCAKRVLKKIEA